MDHTTSGNTTSNLDQGDVDILTYGDEDILTYEVSDGALENAAGTESRGTRSLHCFPYPGC